MSETGRYFLRKRDQETSRGQRSEAESSLEDMEGQPGAAAETSANAIIATLNALRASVEELRQSTAESQSQRLREGMQPQNVPEQSVQPAQCENTQAVVAATDAQVRLYDLPVFSGNVEEWPLFCANFNDTAEAFGYSHRQNLMRLQKCLVGPAKEAVAAMLIFPNDVPNVISELEFRFGRPDILVKFQINKLQHFPPIADSKPEQIVPFSSRVRNVVAFLKSANCQQHLANVTLLEQMVCKLPQHRQFDWAKHAATIQPYPSVEDFSTLLSDLARIICLMPTSNTHSSMQTTSSSNPRRLMHIDRVKESLACYHCNGSHMISQCDSFKSISVQERWELPKAQQLCFSCLRKGHSTLKCRSRRRCNVNECQRYHNQLLHNDEAAVQTLRRVTHEDTTAQPLLNCRVTQNTHGQLFKILPVNIYGPNGKREILAMFDEGSSISIMEAEVAKMIGAKGNMHPLTLQWYDNNVVTEQASKISIEIENCATKKKFALKDVYTVKNLNLPEQSMNKEDFLHLKDLPIKNYYREKPVLLIGLKHAYLGATTATVQSDIESPLAAKTPLGWVAYGPTKSPPTLGARVLFVKEYQQLHDLVNEYFASDSFGVNPPAVALESEEVQRARTILQRTIRRVGKQFEAGLLWKTYPPKLPYSRAMAEKRLLIVERQMRNDGEFSTRYKSEMEKYVNKGYARKLSYAEISESQPHVWYLPHFAVFNQHKPDKTRIVFDAAAAVSNVSLNSQLLKGPEQAQPLLRILLQFRQGRVGVSADIREMFSQIKIRVADQHAQPYLWRDGDASQPIAEYVMTSLIFGAVCSPCIAEYVKNQNAEDHRRQFPDAAATIINKHYVDDLVATFDTPQQAIRICRDIASINSQAGFELRNFVSNCAEVEESMNRSSTTNREAVNMERNESVDKVLGLYWNTSEDVFEFHTKFYHLPKDVLDGTRAPTKRELLRIAMSVFDPFAWKCEIGWDEVLPMELSKRWLPWWQEFPNIKHLKIPRCYSSHISHGGKVEVHIFVDASQVAFAAVGYVRVLHAGGIDVCFMMGKTRTAPVKLMSIPRLELQAAVLGTRVYKLIEDSHEFKIERAVFWTDSQTVLQWVNSSERKYKAFVGHRMAEILCATAKEQWRWVPTSQNAADVATRPLWPPKFDSTSRWVQGPEFLKHNEEYFPTSTITTSAVLLEEISVSVLLVQPGSALIDYSRFSSFSKLLRTTAWLMRATTRVAEIEKAEHMICRFVQRECCPTEIAVLSTTRKITKQSSLYKLSPYLDQSNLLRLSGRIDEATYLPTQARRPILLSQKHIVSTLIVQHFHHKYHHQNFAITINAIRVQQRCQQCVIDKAKPSQPMMGQLPVDRVTPFVRPFTYTGVDLFGPLNVTIGRRKEKRWGVIFTCLTVRAAHIELVENLSTDAVILCLRNFVNRRGTPTRIRSDNGTNFIGAQKELKSAEKLLDTDRIQTEASRYNIEWIFNYPSNPSSGGCWERLIRIIKSLLQKTLREVAPRPDTLLSVLIEAENIINSRPLTSLPISHEDDEPLTPNHFLLGCVNSTQTPHPVDEKICLRKQWRIAQNLKDRLWKRWTTEYLPQLLCRTRWQDKVTPLQPNDLVMLCDSTLPRSQWLRGRVTQVFPTKDGQERVAEVKTKGGILRRPASRLAKLIVGGESWKNSRGAGC